MRKLTKEQFIEKAKSIHGNKYGYDLTCYINHSTKCCFTCFEHGNFWQTPNDHLNGKGCSKCSNNKKLTNIDFIERANRIHNFFYNYEKIFLVNSKVKVCIICYEHGEFLQTPSDHLRGKGCPICKAKKSSLRNVSNTDEFIEKARAIHGDKYNYSKVEYISAIKKICILCNKHGEFLQTPAMHLQGHGCSICKASKGELAIKAILDKYNLISIPQYNIPEIVANYEIDFYLPDHRLLIEFHGVQHYEYIPFFHNGNYTFEDQKRRDELVRDAATRFKYRYLEFNYKQFKHMTEKQFEEMVINAINRI